MANGTFAETLERLESASSLRVIERARLANAVAKVARESLARRRAYEVKSRALQHGITKFPGDYGLCSVENDGRLAAIRYQRACVLHLRIAELTHAASEWMLRQREAILAQRRDERCNQPNSAETGGTVHGAFATARAA